MLQIKILFCIFCTLTQILSLTIPYAISDLFTKRGLITDERMLTSQILRGDQNCGGGDHGPYGLTPFTLWCAQNKDQCAEYSSDDNDFSKRALHELSSNKLNANNSDTLSANEATDIVKRDRWNSVPTWVMCAGPQGQNPLVYSKAQIVAAIEEAVNLWAQRQRTTPTRRGYTYPKKYHMDLNTPYLGYLKQAFVLEFPIIVKGPPYGQLFSGPYPQPGPDRVIFDNCGQFGALMTHNTLDDNQLRPCWEVDSSGRPINTPGVPGSNPNPPPTVGPHGVTGIQIGQVPREWLGLGSGDPYPNPETKFP